MSHACGSFEIIAQESNRKICCTFILRSAQLTTAATQTRLSRLVSKVFR